MIKIEKIDSLQELFLLIRKEQKAVFEFVYKKYSAILFGMALSSVKSKEMASDIVESTFLKLWQYNHSKCQKTSVSVFIIQLHLKTISEYETSKNNNQTSVSGAKDEVAETLPLNIDINYNQQAVVLSSL